jgi:hypothetical protein
MARTDESIWVLEMRVIDHYCRAPRVIGKRYRHNIINRHRWTATLPSHHRTSLPPNLLSAAVMNLQLSDPQWPKLGLVNTDTTHLVVGDKRDHLKHQGPQPLLHTAFAMGEPTSGSPRQPVSIHAAVSTAEGDQHTRQRHQHSARVPTLESQ